LILSLVQIEVLEELDYKSECRIITLTFGGKGGREEVEKDPLRVQLFLAYLRRFLQTHVVPHLLVCVYL
jgi:hypothetical protein